MKILAFLLSLYFSVSAIDFNPLTLYNNYKAINAYRNNDLQTAQELLTQLAGNEQPETIYNAGKVLYKQTEFNKAAAYFEQVTKSDADHQLRKQAYFDRGNALAQLEQWEAALESYEQVVALEPEHKQAQDMIEQIKKILEQQKEQQKKEEDQKQKQQDQEKQKNKNDQQQDQKKSDQQDEPNKSDQSEKNESNDQNNSDQKNDQDNQQSNNQQKNKQENQEDQKNQPHEQNDDERPEEKIEKSGEKQDNRNDQQKEKQRQPDQQKPEQQKKEDMQNKKNAQNDGKADEKKDVDPQPAQSPITGATEEQQKLTEQEALLLSAIEKADAQNIKSLMKTELHKEKTGHGQKNW